MFSNIKQSIPQCFKDKMTFDKRVDHLRSLPVVPFLLYRRVKAFQDTARLKCIVAVRPDPTAPKVM